ncbi:hypothetical protein CBL_10900 [Carabus blaptoides fortunei]
MSIENEAILVSDEGNAVYQAQVTGDNGDVLEQAPLRSETCCEVGRAEDSTNSMDTPRELKYLPKEAMEIFLSCILNVAHGLVLVLVVLRFVLSQVRTEQYFYYKFVV